MHAVAEHSVRCSCGLSDAIPLALHVWWEPEATRFQVVSLHVSTGARTSGDWKMSVDHSTFISGTVEFLRSKGRNLNNKWNLLKHKLPQSRRRAQFPFLNNFLFTLHSSSRVFDIAASSQKLYSVGSALARSPLQQP